MKYYLKGREVEISDSEYDGGCVLITSAGYLDGKMEDLTDDEMDELQNIYASELAQEAYESSVDAANDYYEDR